VAGDLFWRDECRRAEALIARVDELTEQEKPYALILAEVKNEIKKWRNK